MYQSSYFFQFDDLCWNFDLDCPCFAVILWCNFFTCFTSYLFCSPATFKAVLRSGCHAYWSPQPLQYFMYIQIHDISIKYISNLHPSITSPGQVYIFRLLAQYQHCQQQEKHQALHFLQDFHCLICLLIPLQACWIGRHGTKFFLCHKAALHWMKLVLPTSVFPNSCLSSWCR